jgi:hypothetical protein
MLAKLAGCLLLLMALGAVQANADSIYEVIGTLTVPGNSSNPSLHQTINYSFELDYPTNLVSTDGGPLLFSTPTVTSAGPLGTFGMGPANLAPVLVGPSQGYIEFFSTEAEIDLYGSFLTTTAGLPTFTPRIFASYVYSCLTPAVCSEFSPVGSLYPNGGPGGLWWPGTETTSVYQVSTPEPGILCLSVLGAFALWLGKKALTH